MIDHMDKPVHKVLEDYDLLNISVIQNTNTINMSAAMLWRMNLCAVSNEIPCTFFVAMNYRVNVYTLDTIHASFKDPSKSLASPNARQTGGGSESPYIINAIKVDRLLQKEVLVTASENGEVCIWKTENLDEPPMILNNEVGTWGIAIHADQGLLAVSANNWRITIYNILEMTKSNPIYGTRTRKRDVSNMMGSETKIDLAGHEHNIPNIDFSDSGRYIASVSIDQTCRVWDIVTRKVVTQKKLPAKPNEEQDSWCWSVKFIKPGFFKFAVCIDKNISQAYLQRVYQGRSTSLTNLGLCHSAPNPMFPTNVSNVYGLEEEEIDFTIYDDEIDAEDNIWDFSLLQEEDDVMEEVFERQRREDEFIYNHGEIQNEIRDDTQQRNTDGTESGTDESFETAEGEPNSDEVDSPRSIEYRYLSEPDDVDPEIASEYAFNQMRRESAQSRRNDMITMEDVELTEQEATLLERGTSTFFEAEDDAPEDWSIPAGLPTPNDWTRTIVNDNPEGNRDGWGDEIVTPIRNNRNNENQSDPTSTQYNYSNTSRDVLRAILQGRIHAINDEDIPSFVSSRNGSGWDDSVEDNTTADEEAPSEQDTHSTNSSSNTRSPPYCIPNVMRSTSSSNNNQVENQDNNKKDSKKLNHQLGEYLMISTGKDVMLMSTTAPKMTRVRAEHNMINKVDVRSDQMLSVLDRINMVEWLPELELYVAASQKGTVALMRILQVEFEGGEQACIFNNECYLPTNVLQATPLYGMTVKKVVSERFTPISYQIFLFYYSGNVLGYTVSRKDSDLLVENLIL